jgi:hypothetical protein
MWEGLLSATGGELQLSKCFYYVLSWKWDKYGRPSPQNKLEQQITTLILKMTTHNTSEEITKKMPQKSQDFRHSQMNSRKRIYPIQSTIRKK